MGVTIDINPNTLFLTTKVRAKGVSVDEVLHDALSKADEEHLQERLSPEEWIESF